MKVYWIQHVEFEGLGCIEPWLEENGHDAACIRLWAGDVFPDPGEVDGLIVMGGPMGIYDDDQYLWLADEKGFINEVIDRDKPVLGICLGAQLIADVLGADVRPGEQKEIGFYECRASVPLALNDRAGRSALFPKRFVPFHWHGDTFGLPDGAVRLASSEVTENQAFRYKDNVLALQFHLETTERSLMSLYDNCCGEICDAPFIQTLDEMRPFFSALERSNELIFCVLRSLFG